MVTRPLFTESQPHSAPNLKIVIVGVDGFLGGCLAGALQAEKVVYGPCRDGDVHVSQAEQVLERADVIVNAGGFRVRPGCTYADYQRSHQGAISALVPWIRENALLLHFSSASVLGQSKHQKLGNSAAPDPKTFPSPAYALAKCEADLFIEKAAAERGFRAIFLRPAAVYGPQGAGMVDTLLKLAKRRIILRLYPRNARHHLCYTGLLVDVVRRVIQERERLPHLSRFVVADPYTVTNRELETIIRCYLREEGVTVPLAVGVMSAVMRRSFHSRNPKFDLKTWGEILGVMNLDTEYDPTDTFQVLSIDKMHYSLERTLRPVIRQVLQS